MAARRSPSVLVFALLTIILAGLGCTPARPSTATSSAPATAASTATAAAPSPSPTAAPAFPVTLTDDEGTAVTIPDEPKRIVSLTPDATETLFVLGVGDRIVGKVQDPANFPPEAASIPEVATFSGVDVEKIVALEPDLVISGGAGLTQGAAVEQLRRAGIPVLVNYPTTIDGALAGMRRLGQAVGVPDVANARAGALKDRLEQLAALAATATEKPRLFYEIDVTGGIFTPPADSIYGEMFRLAGAEPIPGNASYGITLEELVAADPEVILLGDGAYGVTPDAVAARSGWGGMTAVRDGRIVAVDDVVITRPGPRLAEGLVALIGAIHPDLLIELPFPSFSLAPIELETDKPTT